MKTREQFMQERDAANETLHAIARIVYGPDYVRPHDDERVTLVAAVEAGWAEKERLRFEFSRLLALKPEYGGTEEAHYSLVKENERLRVRLDDVASEAGYMLPVVQAACALAEVNGSADRVRLAVENYRKVRPVQEFIPDTDLGKDLDKKA